MMNVANPVARQVSPPGSHGEVRPPALLSVELREGEDAQWIWTHYADGRSIVTGYRIVPQLPRSLQTLLGQGDRSHG